MGIFSKTCEYALRAVMYIAQCSQQGEKAGIREIAEAIKSPEAFLGKILQQLSKEGLIRSAKGPNGGFYMNPEDTKRPLADIVRSIDGAQLFEGCAMGLDYCSKENPCPLHHDFKKIRKKLSVMLQETSIGQFNMDLIKGNFTLSK
ncbi:RrF2 family transcriptional regulator [Sphingobacterium spiritivorum]|uniref:RrF2 family transcriptional regulator n=1 Tax=Sphingobacterium spiritivorum TaxID=258 RepID=UPI003DA52C4B